jgi:5-methylcytosine-specific restriction endonuclease McrA
MVAPDIIIVAYNKTDIIMHQCFSCRNRFIPDSPLDVFCTHCEYNEELIPCENKVPTYVRGFIIDYEIEVDARIKRSPMNYRKVLARDMFTCRYCKITPFFNYNGITQQMSVDHITPFISGGSNKMSNLVTACRQCNSIANDKYFESLLDKKVYIQTRRQEKGLKISFHKETSDFINENPKLYFRMLERAIRNKKYYSQYIKDTEYYKILTGIQ